MIMVSVTGYHRYLLLGHDASHERFRFRVDFQAANACSVVEMPADSAWPRRRRCSPRPPRTCTSKRTMLSRHRRRPPSTSRRSGRTRRPSPAVRDSQIHSKAHDRGGGAERGGAEQRSEMRGAEERREEAGRGVRGGREDAPHARHAFLALVFTTSFSTCRNRDCIQPNGREHPAASPVPQAQ